MQKTKKLNIKCDFKTETDYLQINVIDDENLLLPQMNFQIEIYFKPTKFTNKRYKKNHRFHIFLETIHPNVILEIPIFSKISFFFNNFFVILKLKIYNFSNFKYTTRTDYAN